MRLFRKKKDSLGFTKDAVLSENSPFAYSESYKTLRANFNFTTRNGKLKKIMLTSSLPGETKSTTCINLALSLAKTGARVALVDCDLRKGNICRYMRVKPPADHGMSNVISGGLPLEECVFRSEAPGVWVVPSGTVPPNPSELLNDDHTGEVLDRLAQKFDYVICDSTPVNVVSDALGLSRFCDGVVLVVRQGYAKKEEIRHAAASLRAVGANVIGCIMGRYSDKHASNGYYHSNYYYYSKYGNGYGYSKPQNHPQKISRNET